MAFGSAITAVFGADTAPLSKGSKEAEGIVGKFTKSVEDEFKKVGQLLLAGAIMGFFKTVIEKGGALQDLSDRLQVGTDELQAFDFAVRQAGGTSEQANMTWDKSRKALDSLAAGQDTAVKQFAALGLKASDFIGLDLPSSLEKIAKAYGENIQAAGAYDAVTDILGSKSAPALNAVLLQLGQEGFPALVKGAKDAGQVMSAEAIASMDEFGDRVDALKGKLTTWGSVAFNAVGQFAQGLGILVADLTNKFDRVKTSVNETDWLVKKAVATIKEVAPSMKEQEEADKRKKDIATERAKLEEYIAKATRDQLEPQGRISAIQKEIVERSKALAAAGGDELKQAKEKLKINELDNEAKKLIRAEEAKFTEATRLSKEGEIELVRLSLKAATGLTAEEARRLEILRLQQEQLAIQYEIKQVLVKGVEKLTAADKIRIDGLRKQKEFLDQQISGKEALIASAHQHVDAEKAVTEELTAQAAKIKSLKEEWASYSISVTRTGKGYTSQSTTALEGVRDRLMGHLSDPSPNSGRAIKDATQGQDYGGWLMAVTYQTELAAVEKELAQRKSVAAYARQYGEDAAVYKFGDDLAQRALADLNSSQIRTTTAVEQIARRFNAF